MAPLIGAQKNKKSECYLPSSYKLSTRLFFRLNLRISSAPPREINSSPSIELPIKTNALKTEKRGITIPLFSCS